MNFKTAARAITHRSRVSRFAKTIRSEAGRYGFVSAVVLASACVIAHAETVIITIQEDPATGHFSPEFPPDIHVGDTVTWIWSDRLLHSATSIDRKSEKPDGVFDSGIHTAPFSYSKTFDTVGSFPYNCRQHYRGNTTHIWATINVVPTGSTTPGVVGNISTRLHVGTDTNVLIGGFIVSGTQPKKVIVRAIGPSLPVSGALANPTLELYSGQTLLESNDNWVDSPNKQAIIDSTIPPSSSLESAIVRILPANNSDYTAVVRGVNQDSGVGLVEVYDLDQTVDSKLANISTRGSVQTDASVMIGGFIVQNGLQKVIARAIGPSLLIEGKLANPQLEMYDVNGTLIQANDDWRTGGQEAEIIATTVPPSNDFESALVRTLPAGNYTAIVRGINHGVGVALVEVFALN